MAVGAPPPPAETSSISPEAPASDLTPSAALANAGYSPFPGRLPRADVPGLSPAEFSKSIARAPKSSNRQAHRAAANAGRGLPPNRRYVPPVTSMGYLR
jgi:hypothetical protein